MLNIRNIQRVAPGQGSESTRLRNQRRKRARKYVAIAETSGAIVETPAVDAAAKTPVNDAEVDLATAASSRARSASAFPAIPSSLSQFVSGASGARPSSPLTPANDTVAHANDAQVTTQDVAISTGGLMNRNKKKGFLKDMSALQRTKTVFGPNESVALDATPDVSMVESEGAGDLSRVDLTLEPEDASTPIKTAKTGRQAKRAKWNRVIPPSECELPSNVFVSSAEFTVPRPDRRGRQSQGAPRTGASEIRQKEVEKRQRDAGQATDGAHAQTSAVLTTPIAEKVGTAASGGEMTPKELAWTKIEIGFEALDHVSNSSAPSVGTTIAWKVSRRDCSS